MGNYYSAIEVKDNKFLGSVYVESTNQLVFQTQLYSTQSQVLADINTFITTNKPPEVSAPAPQNIPTRTITNTIKTTTNIPLPVVRGRCCGR